MDIRLLRTEDDYNTALTEIEKLMEKDVEPGTPEGDRFELLVLLVEKYEDEHYPVPLPDPIAAIEYYLESRGLSRSELERFIGSRARVSEILNKRRALSLRMIRNLSDGLGIPAEILIQDYKLDGEQDAEEDDVIRVKFTHGRAFAVSYVDFFQTSTIDQPPIVIPENHDLYRHLREFSVYQ
jgi:HTH-type transcriptional regulator/antitoxin HigA